MIAGLLALVTGSPLSAEQLGAIAAVIVVILWVASFLDEKAEITEIRDQAHRITHRGRVLRIINARRWR